MNIVKWLSISDRYTKIFLDKKLASLGLNSSQYMYILRICDEPGMTQSEFIEMFYINPSNITRAIISLEANGFIERRMSSDDKRIWRLYPTKKAEESYAKIISIREEWYQYALKDFTEQEKEQYLKFLEMTGRTLLNILKEEEESGTE